MSAATPSAPVVVKRDCFPYLLNEAVGIHVAKLPGMYSDDGRLLIGQREQEHNGGAFAIPFPDFANSVDLLVPLLKGRHWQSWTQGEGKDRRVYFAIYPEKGDKASYEPTWGPTLARALAFALLRQAGVNVEDAP